MQTDQIIDVRPVSDIRPLTTFETGKGTLQVIHEITLGDLLISTLLLALIIFTVLARIIK